MAAAAGALVLAILLATRGAPVTIGVGYDDAIYVDLARSLASGNGYRHGYLPGTPAGVHYPPLFPIWLSLWGALGRWTTGASTWLTLGNVLLTATAAGIWTAWGIRALSLPRLLALSVAAASVLIYPARVLSALAFSEPLGWLLLGAAALADATNRAWWARAVVAGMLPLVRTILVPFPAAFAFDRARIRGGSPWARAGAIVVALSPMALWMIWTASRSAELPAAWEGSYGSYARMYVAAGFGARELWTIATLQLAALASLGAEMFTVPGAIVVLVCVLAGLVRLARLQSWLAVGTLGYIALVLLWPFTPERFVWGLLPLLALAGVDGGRFLAMQAGARGWMRGAIVAVLLTPIAIYGWSSIRSYRSLAWLAPLQLVAARNEPLAVWGRSLPDRSPVATETDGLFALETGLSAFPIVSPEPADKVGRGTSIEHRIDASLCTVGEGWIALTSLSTMVAEGVRSLVRDGSSRVRFGEPERLGGGAVVARFSCAADAFTTDRRLPSAPSR